MSRRVSARPCRVRHTERVPVDPDAGATAAARAQKVRNQSGVRIHAPSSLYPHSRPPAQRSAAAYILARQATGLLQRMRLHAVNSTWHMLLDVVYFVGPALLMVGSRGMGQLKGILFGSTSHYLV
jgi:nucleotide-binding universal stress UspA family protein